MTGAPVHVHAEAQYPVSKFNADRGIESIEIVQADGATEAVTVDVYIVGLALRAAAEEAAGARNDDSEYAKQIIETLERFGIRVSGVTAVDVQTYILERLADLKKKPDATPTPASEPNSPPSTTSTPSS